MKETPNEFIGLPDYVFTQKFDCFYFFWHPLLPRTEYKAFYHLFLTLTSLLNRNTIYIEALGVEPPYDEKIIINLEKADENHWLHSPPYSVRSVILTTLPNLYIYDDSSLWCAYTDITADIIIFGIKKEINDFFLKALKEMKAHEGEYATEISLEDYLKWQKDLFLRDDNKNYIQNFQEKLIENYGK